MRTLLRKSLTDITRRKLRSVLIILGILISVLGLTSIFTSNETISSALAYSADHSTTPDFEIVGEGGDGGYKLTDQLKAVANVRLLQMDSLDDCRWEVSVAPGRTGIAIYGYQNFHQVLFTPFDLVSGRYPTKGEIVLEASDNSIQAVSIGDSITIDTQDRAIQLKVVGFSRTLGLRSPATTGLAQGYVSDDTILLLQGHVANHIQVKVYDSSKISRTMSAITDILAAHHIQVADAHQTANTFDLVQNQLNGFVQIIQLLAIGALILTSFLILNIVSTLITEQTKIIGTMKAMGGTRGKILCSYLFSVLIYGLVGTLLALPLGIFIGYQLTLFMASRVTFVLGPYTFSPWLLALSLGTGIVIPLFAALVPAWIGTQITVREAMSAYGVSAGRQNRTSLSRWKSVFNRMPQTFALGWRGTFRKPGRATLTMAALVLSGIAFLCVQTATYSIQQYTQAFYAPYDYDVMATVGPDPKAELLTVLQAVPNLKRAESFAQGQVDTHWGILQVNAVETDTQMYTHQLLSGRWLSKNDTNAIVLSDDVLQRTGLHLGDSLNVTDQQGKTASWHIIGTVHDVSGPSGGLGVGVTSVSVFDQFRGVSTDLAWGLLIQGVDRSPQAVSDLSTNVYTVLTQAGLNGNVISLQESLARAESRFQPVAPLLYAFASLIAAVGLLALVNMLTTSVLERQREVGIWRSIGATGRMVAGVFWIEGVSLSLLGWLLSIALGIPLAYVFVIWLNHVLIPVSFAFDPLILAEMLAIILAMTTVACVGPALNASRMRIVEILHYE
jgi:putative ABC transport system permease protein